MDVEKEDMRVVGVIEEEVVRWRRMIRCEGAKDKEDLHVTLNEPQLYNISVSQRC